MKSIKAILNQAEHLLKPGTMTARLDAEVLLAHAIHQTRTYLHTWPDRELPAEHIDEFNSMIDRRIQGEPVAYLTGQQEFWSLPISVSPDTLIPRPETELLVELALQHIPKERCLQIADLGTGSGAIALAIAHERPACRIFAADISTAALAIARHNAEQLDIKNISFIESNWFSALETQTFDIIVANPPYVHENDPYLGQGDLRFEPATALTSGPTGLEAINTITSEARQHLIHGGWLLFEHGYDQGNDTLALLNQHGYSNIECVQDMAGHNRITLGQYNPE